MVTQQSFFARAAAFRFAAIITLVVGALVIYYLGPTMIVPLLILTVIEVMFSFDNAIINAKILKTLSPLWRRLFLTVGIIIAVFGMRLLFPILLVSITAQTGFGETIHLALNAPKEYAHELEQAHPAISAFGGMFLLLLALHFFMAEDKHRRPWIRAIEIPLNKVGNKWSVLALTIVLLAIIAFIPLNEHRAITLIAGGSAIVLFYAIGLLRSGIAKINDRTNKGHSGLVTGWAAFFSFLYLEVLDASFSLDAVLGAFAVTNDVILIAAGLGIGAVWVRSLTVFMIKRGTLDSFVFLEHGAHYAILLLAASLLLALFYEVPSALIGVIGLVLIGASVWASRRVRA